MKSLRISQNIREDGSCFSTDSSEKETAEKDKKRNTDSPIRKAKTLD